MRAFDDEEGGHWQAAVLDASYGNALLVFSQIGGSGVLKSDLYAANLAEAMQIVAAMDEAELRSALAQAVPMQ